MVLLLQTHSFENHETPYEGVPLLPVPGKKHLGNPSKRFKTGLQKQDLKRKDGGLLYDPIPTRNGLIVIEKRVST